MHSFKSILCAVDTSAVASRVLRHAVGMAGAFGARLTVLSVSHGDLRAAEQVLRDQVNDAVPPGAAYPADLQVRVVRLALGTVVDALLDACGPDVDLIVTGTHSKTGLSRWLLGSTSAAILAETTCATLLVPQGQLEIVRLEPDRAVLRPGAVLVAVDLEEDNPRQLALASQCAARAGQPLVALTVVPVGGDMAVAEQALRARVAEVVPAPVSKCLVRQGSVVESIDLAAIEEHAGLVVMGLSQKGARGEVATAVLKTKDAVVLAVPPTTR
jgi:nucleotide-binding universal stress UspA family protein